MGRRSNGEGSLSKRKDGRWQAAYTDNGKRKYLYGKTRKEVAQKLNRTLTEKDGTHHPNIGVVGYLNRWLEHSVKESVRPGRTSGTSPSAGSTLCPASVRGSWPP